MSRNIAIVGLGFGDEGKGMVTSSLVERCLKEEHYDKIIVVRYSGGHQAGHTVRINDMSHVFANFGSGTLQGIPTYWSRACTVDPVGLTNELKTLVDTMEDDVYDIELLIDKGCPITTPYDITHNRSIEEINEHGTCGVGFGTTIGREEENIHLHFEDLFNPTVMDIKLKLIADYYIMDEKPLEEFREAVRVITSSGYFPSDIIKPVDNLPSEYDTCIFEGSQGLLLDKEIGFFPHVTRSSVGLKGLTLQFGSVDEVFYVTRAYQTRHGNGPMTDESNIGLYNTENESNKKYEYQGEFRTGILDIGLLKYAIENDRRHVRSGPAREEHLVITCMDQLKTFKTIENGNVVMYRDVEAFVKAVADTLNIKNKVHLSWSGNSEITQL